MILNGSQRGGARDLAIHLLKPENEHVELHELRGVVADDLAGALREVEAVSRGTRCRQFLYSLSLSPPETERVPVSAFERAIDGIEDRLGLAGQPRVIVFHEKQGRRHAHCVWSRIDAASMKAVRMSHDRMKLTEISRELYREHGWRMPDGLIDRRLRNPLNFVRQEWFKAKRSGKDPRDIKAVFQQCWAASDSGKAFRQALEQRGYHLARGDRRAVVAVDLDGEVFAVARWAGVKTKLVVDRMGDLSDLPGIDDVRARVATLVRDKLSGFLTNVTEEFNRAVEPLEAARIAMVQLQRQDRSALKVRQQQRADKEAQHRATRFRTGMRGLWDRVTGRQTQIRRQNEQEAEAARQRDLAEREGLIQAQLSERQGLQRDIRRARQRHVRGLAQVHRELAMAAQRYEPVARPAVEHETQVPSRTRRRTRPGP